jgi:hypothetical protein
MINVITRGAYSDYEIIGLVECDFIGDAIPHLLGVYFDEKELDKAFYSATYNLITGKGWSYSDFEGFDQYKVEREFPEWLVNESGLKKVEFNEYHLR